MTGDALRTAVILAAGRGTRMWPFGETKPKAALPLLNRPNVAAQVDHVRDLGFRHIIVVVGYLGGAVRHALRHDSEITYVAQAQPTGTADALRLALEAVDDEEFLVLYGDVATTAQAIRDLLVHGAEAADAGTALVVPLGRERPQDWLCPQVAGGHITRIWGHPRGEVEHRLAGVFALNRRIVPYLDAHPEFMTSVQVGTMPPTDRDLGMSLHAMVQDGASLGSVETREPCFDLDKPWHLLAATRALLDAKAGGLQDRTVAESAVVDERADVRGTVVLGERVYIGPRVIFQGNAWVDEGSIIDTGAIIGPNCRIGRGCDVRDGCKLDAYTVLGDGCRVGHGAELSGVFFDNVWAVHSLEMWGVVGSSSDLGAATVCGTLRFDDGLTAQRIGDRREVAGEFANACYLGDYTRTGVNAILMPGCKVGPHSIVGPGVVLDEDLPAETLVTVEQTLRRRRWGPKRYGW